mmetsp:Transcript_15709/g.15847  ORF Transcript_15709/g.15847 Transcript_15709/m.15847 type:complete len:332 (-) Transcript_15709:267-1262(-)
MYFRSRENNSVGFKTEISSSVKYLMSLVKRRTSGWPDASDSSRNINGNFRVNSEPIKRHSSRSPRFQSESIISTGRQRRSKASPPTTSKPRPAATIQPELPNIIASNRRDVSAKSILLNNRRVSETRTVNIIGSQASTSSTTSSNKSPCCDKCDGKHQTDECPYYKKQRDNHPDAQKGDRSLGGTSMLPGSYYPHARIVKQPGDGSCLFHSLSYGLRDGSAAHVLRNEICNFIERNPDAQISETPLKDWVRWDSGVSVGDYARRMARGAWGGGIEMASVSKLKRVNVHVYERCSSGFKRISAFDHPDSPETRKTIRVLYCGGVHYDALVVN